MTVEIDGVKEDIKEIKDTLKTLSNAIVTLARVEENQVALASSIQGMSERVSKNTKDINHIWPEVRVLKTIVYGIMWVAGVFITGAVGVFTSSSIFAF